MSGSSAGEMSGPYPVHATTTTRPFSPSPNLAGCSTVPTSTSPTRSTTRRHHCRNSRIQQRFAPFRCRLRPCQHATFLYRKAYLQDQTLPSFMSHRVSIATATTAINILLSCCLTLSCSCSLLFDSPSPIGPRHACGIKQHGVFHRLGARR